eukprot:1094529_1
MMESQNARSMLNSVEATHLKVLPNASDSDDKMESCDINETDSDKQVENGDSDSDCVSAGDWGPCDPDESDDENLVETYAARFSYAGEENRVFKCERCTEELDSRFAKCRMCDYAPPAIDSGSSAINCGASAIDHCDSSEIDEKNEIDEKTEALNGIWTCAQCTLENSIENEFCAACNLSRPTGAGVSPALDREFVNVNLFNHWICRRCSLENHDSLVLCSGCLLSRTQSLAGDRLSLSPAHLDPSKKIKFWSWSFSDETKGRSVQSESSLSPTEPNSDDIKDEHVIDIIPALSRDDCDIDILPEDENLTLPLLEEDEEFVSRLHGAVRSNDLLASESLLAPESVDVNLPGPKRPHMTALMLASHLGFTKVMSLLLSHGSSIVDTNDLQGATALHYACRANKPDAAEMLLSHGASPNATDKRGWFPLMIGVDLGSEPLARLLLSAPETNVNAVSRDIQETALHSAAREGKLDLVVLLVSKGASLTAKDADGNTPRELAASGSEIARFLLNTELSKLFTSKKVDGPGIDTVQLSAQVASYL